jgi:hypothetical protein
MDANAQMWACYQGLIVPTEITSIFLPCGSARCGIYINRQHKHNPRQYIDYDNNNNFYGDVARRS